MSDNTNADDKYFQSSVGIKQDSELYDLMCEFLSRDIPTQRSFSFRIERSFMELIKLGYKDCNFSEVLREQIKQFLTMLKKNGLDFTFYGFSEMLRFLGFYLTLTKESRLQKKPVYIEKLVERIIHQDKQLERCEHCGSPFGAHIYVFNNGAKRFFCKRQCKTEFIEGLRYNTGGSMK